MPTIRTMAEDDEVSPEEKLLKVIQGEGEVEEGRSLEEKLLDAVQSEEPEAATAATIVEPAPVAEPAAVPVAAPPKAASSRAEPPKEVPAEAVPKLKLAEKKTAPPAEPVAVAGPETKRVSKPVPVAEPESAASRAERARVGADGTVGAVTMAPGGTSRRTEQVSSGLGVVNWALAAAIFLMISLTGRAMWGSIREAMVQEGGMEVSIESGQHGQDGDAAAPDSDAGTERAAASVDSELYDIEQVVTVWVNDDPFKQVAEAPPLPPDENGGKKPPPPPLQTPWEQYVRKNFKMLGISRVSGTEMEGISASDTGEGTGVTSGAPGC